MYLASDWKDYEIIDAGGGNKHERWADVTLLRPDPQAVWPMKEPRSVHARYIRSSAGGGPLGVRPCAAGKLENTLSGPYLYRPPHRLQAYRPFPGTGGELGLDAWHRGKERQAF